MIFLRLACVKRLEGARKIDPYHSNLYLQRYLNQILSTETIEPEPKPKRDFLLRLLLAAAVLPIVFLLLILSHLFSKQQWENFWNQFLEN